jgi:lysophospholipase L1-like esterase
MQTEATKAYPHRLRRAAFFILFILLLFMIGLEVVGRFLTHTNSDGQRVFLYLPLRPFQFPITDTTIALDRYNSSTDTELIYDPLLGWTNRPNVPNYNAAGMRADREYTLDPPDGVLRIAAFGDSFTHGNEVERTDSWAYQLETILNEQGVHAEVLNFGVGGYGLDQAYLRWQQQGRAYQPDVVLVGLVSLDIPRTVTLYWKFAPAMIPLPNTNIFTKPRFILDDGALRLVNSPTAAPSEILDFLASFPTSELAPYENEYNPDDYQNKWWLNSYALAILDALRRYVTFTPAPQLDLSRPTSPARPENDATTLAAAILSQWAGEASADGSRFVVVEFPLRPQLESRAERVSLRDALGFGGEWLDTAPAFPQDNLAAQFEAGGHYSPAGNTLVAQNIAQYLVTHPHPENE